MKLQSLWTSLLAAIAAVQGLLPQAHAQDVPACENVRFADVGWSDIAATTGMASVVLDAMGYTPSVTVASVPITFAALKSRQIDEFLGYWTPSMTPIAEPFIKAGQIKVLTEPHLVGAQNTLAVPATLYDKGLRRFEDVARFAKELDNKIHGIEPGNDGNALIQGMIAIENQVMLSILDKQKPDTAGRNWLRKKPQVLEAWLKGVKTLGGQDALPAVTSALAGK